MNSTIGDPSKALFALFENSADVQKTTIEFFNAINGEMSAVLLTPVSNRLRIVKLKGPDGKDAVLSIEDSGTLLVRDPIERPLVFEDLSVWSVVQKGKKSPSLSMGTYLIHLVLTHRLPGEKGKCCRECLMTMEGECMMSSMRSEHLLLCGSGRSSSSKA